MGGPHRRPDQVSRREGRTRARSRRSSTPPKASKRPRSWAFRTACSATPSTPTWRLRPRATPWTTGELRSALRRAARGPQGAPAGVRPRGASSEPARGKVDRKALIAAAPPSRRPRPASRSCRFATPSARGLSSPADAGDVRVLRAHPRRLVRRWTGRVRASRAAEWSWLAPAVGLGGLISGRMGRPCASRRGRPRPRSPIGVLAWRRSRLPCLAADRSAGEGRCAGRRGRGGGGARRPRSRSSSRAGSGSSAPGSTRTCRSTCSPPTSSRTATGGG